MLLLSDGSVMAKGFAPDGTGNAWYRLKPDVTGSYINGSWTVLQPMNDTREYFSVQLLTDGRVFVAGGEYPRDTNNNIIGRATAEIYDPVTNIWTYINPPVSLLDPASPSPALGNGNQAFSDSVSEILPDGSVLVAPVGPNTYGGTLIYSAATNSWSAGPTLANNVGYQDEAAWVKLPDDSILTIDPFGQNGYSERYIPSLNSWVSDANVPVNLYDPYGGEEGAGFLLPNGQAFFLGSTGVTALYTPSGSTAAGSWTAGPVIPNSQGTPDAPAAMMVNGKILCAVSPLPTSAQHFPSPTSFYEYDYSTNTFNQVNGPTGQTQPEPSYPSVMLDLPDGTVLYADSDSQLYVYQPAGGPLASGKPTISSVTLNQDGSYQLTGTLLNGISEGAAYGDDWQMATNYPIVRLADSLGRVYYARTYNWSSRSVMTANQSETTTFTLPANLSSTTTYSLVVVANGIASDPVPFSITSTPTPTP